MNKPDSHPKRRPIWSSARNAGADHQKAGKQTRAAAPTKAETARLPAFEGLSLDQIRVPKTRAECRDATDEILAAGLGGFDTEARPTFQAGRQSDGPHVVQFALTDKAFIFQLYRSSAQAGLQKIQIHHHQ